MGHRFSYLYVLWSSDQQKVENVCAGHSRKELSVCCGGWGEILTALPCPGLLCSDLPSPVQSHFALSCPTLSHPTMGQ